MIETDRLILRPFKLTDHADMLEYQSNPDVVRYVPWPVRTPELVQEALEKGLSCTKLEKQGDSVLLSIQFLAAVIPLGPAPITQTRGFIN